MPIPDAAQPSAPAGGPSSLPGQPPFGASPLTMPVPNRGEQAAGMALVRNAVNMLSQALPKLGAETEPGQAVLKALQGLGKHVPPGATTPGAQHAQMQNFMMGNRQQNPLLQTLAAMGGGGAGGAPSGSGGASPVPPGSPGSGAGAGAP